MDTWYKLTLAVGVNVTLNLFMMLERTGGHVSLGCRVLSCAHYLEALACEACGGFVWFDFSFLVQKVRVTATRKLNRGETENDGEGSRGRNEAQKKKHTKTTEWRCY